MGVDDLFAALWSMPERTGIFTDFDGTLSGIVDRPADAKAIEGAADVLERLAESFAVVAIVSGRSLVDLRRRLAPRGVLLAGSYGRERSDRGIQRPRSDEWEAVAAAAIATTAGLPGVAVERKRAGIALHYRQAPQLARDVAAAADALARRFGLTQLPGRLVVELVRPGPTKADAIAALATEHELSSVVIAGDDVADLEAFRWARSSGLDSVLVAVASAEMPSDLTTLADVVVTGPGEVVELLRQLADAGARR